MNARDLSRRLSEFLRREQVAMAEFLVALADFDRRRGWEQLGYTSLFTFLHRELGLSKGAAFYRKTAADLVRRVPEVVGPLEDGRLCITSVVELAKVLTPENRDEVLPRFFHRSRDEAREVVAELKPVERAPVRDVVTAVSVSLALPARTAPEQAAVPTVDDPSASARRATGGGWLANLVDANSRAPTVNAPTSRAGRDAVEPLTAERSRLHVTVSRRLLAKLEAAREALSHSHPGASTEAILEAGLDLVLAAPSITSSPRGSRSGTPGWTSSRSAGRPTRPARAREGVPAVPDPATLRPPPPPPDPRCLRASGGHCSAGLWCADHTVTASSAR